VGIFLIILFVKEKLLANILRALMGYCRETAVCWINIIFIPNQQFQSENGMLSLAKFWLVWVTDFVVSRYQSIIKFSK
jgi:hypothetical protein